ncbi:tape measure protein [Candidatus Pacearchaeota archaeon]|nr:tape measure protein [Candidatus Pacearchaeota archaeon]
MASIRDLFVTIGFDIDEKPLAQIDRNIRNVQAGAKKLAIVFAGASVSIGFFLKQAGDFEQVEIAFEAMLGSAEAAKELLDGLKEDARRTPFTLPGILDAGKRLLAMGIEAGRLRDTIKILGDVAAGVGIDKLPNLVLALGQVKAATKLRGSELRQFTEAGVPLLAELAESLGKTPAEIQELISKGAISFEDVRKALENLTTGSGRFADLMERQSKSFLGMLSNIKDFVNINAIAIGKELLPQAKAIAKEFLTLLEVNKEIIKTRAVKFFKEMSVVIGILFKSIMAIVEGILNITDALGGLGNVIKNVTLLMLGFVSLQIISGIGATTQAVFGLIGAMKTLGTAALFTQAKMIAMPLLIGAAVIALGLIIEDVIAFFRGKNSITGVVIESVRNAFIAVIEEVAGFLSNITNQIANFVKSPIQSLAGFIKSGFGMIGLGPDTAPAAGGGGTTNNQSSVNAPIIVNVPAGTSPEVVAIAAENGVKSAMETIFRQTDRALKPRVAQ